jgi:hypothetical protein
MLVSICLVSLLAAGLFALNAIPSVTASGTKAKPQSAESGVDRGPRAASLTSSCEAVIFQPVSQAVRALEY